MSMARHAVAQHLPAQHIQRRKQSGGPITDVIVGLALGQARTQKENRLSAVQSLNLALLIDA